MQQDSGSSQLLYQNLSEFLFERAACQIQNLFFGNQYEIDRRTELMFHFPEGFTDHTFNIVPPDRRSDFCFYLDPNPGMSEAIR